MSIESYGQVLYDAHVQLSLTIAIRFEAMSKYVLSSSIPMKLNFSSIAAFPVEPDPMNGSSTVPFGWVTKRQR